ncbi:MAG TPA: class I SAM-dependent methyltransferase [Planctomycetota bacterium]
MVSGVPGIAPASLTGFRCRSCGADAGDGTLTEVLDLGTTPLANRLLATEELAEPEPVWPLRLVFCAGCGLCQITETVPPETLFREYVYFSSFSDTMVAHARDLAAELAAQLDLGAGSLVVEAASNDGYLLQWFHRAGIPVLGVEPARNVAVLAREKGVDTWERFFGLETARAIVAERGRADLFLAANVFAHVADPNDFVAGIEALLGGEGVAVIEAPYVREMVERVEFDTIYHEHLCYFSLTAMEAFFRRHGLRAVDVERIPLHGGSLKVTAARAGARRHPAAAVAALLQEERELGVDRAAYFAEFGARVARLREQLTALLGRLKADGRSIAAYGAAAKGSTLLNCFGIGAETLDFVVDRSTVKQGLHMPGVRLPIHAPEHLLKAAPDYVLLLTWNFADEILAQQAEYRRRGGRFIVPVPEPFVVEPAA